MSGISIKKALVVALCVAEIACVSPVYVAGPVHAPVLKEAGNVSLGGGLSLIGGGAQLQGAVAVASHGALAMDLRYAWKGAPTLLEADLARGMYKHYDHFQLNGWLLGGAGHTDSGYQKGPFVRTGVQGDFIGFGDFIWGGLVLRTDYLRFWLNRDFGDAPIGTESFGWQQVLIEPIALLGFGPHWLGFEVQGGLVISMLGTEASYVGAVPGWYYTTTSGNLPYVFGGLISARLVSRF